MFIDHCIICAVKNLILDITRIYFLTFSDITRTYFLTFLDITRIEWSEGWCQNLFYVSYREQVQKVVH